MYERENGRFTLQVQYRNVDGDSGLCIHVFGPTAISAREEVLRFDCFNNQPHYHLAWSYRRDPFITIEDSDPFSWALGKLRTNINELLQAAEAVEMTPVELQLLQESLSLLRIAGERELTNAA